MPTVVSPNTVSKYLCDGFNNTVNQARPTLLFLFLSFSASPSSDPPPSSAWPFALSAPQGRCSYSVEAPGCLISGAAADTSEAELQDESADAMAADGGCHQIGSGQLAGLRRLIGGDSREMRLSSAF